MNKSSQKIFTDTPIYDEVETLEVENLAIDNGKNEIAIISGIGSRNYYRKFGYERKGPYMAKKLI